MLILNNVLPTKKSQLEIIILKKIAASFLSFSNVQLNKINESKSHFLSPLVGFYFFQI